MEKDEINEIFRMLRISTSEEELNIICDSLDFHKDGNVNYTEFLAASLSSEFFLKEEKLKFVFKFFDRFNNNYITPQDIIKVTKDNEIPINEEEVLKKFNGDSSRKVYFEDFKKLMSMDSL